ncbi:MAG: hypothetical protein HQL82_03445 [Magnetococcales bacterium]|nr:hypothetical protein [Magnetococcales bacterium]
MHPEARAAFFLAADRLPDPLPAWEYHVHSRWSDGSADLATVVRVAVAMGLRRVVFTEHTEPGLTPGAGWFGTYAAEVRALAAAQAGVVDLRVGLEVPAMDYDGGLDLTAEMIEGTDFILGAVHALPERGCLGGRGNPRDAIDREFRALMGLLDNPLVDALAHPGGVCQRYVAPFPMELFEAVVEKAAVRGVAIELNPAYQEPMQPYFDLCRRHGALISPGSNAHRPEEMGLALQVLEQVRVMCPEWGGHPKHI